ncbi:sigma-54-dependent transcriptional regulator [Paraprevotella clara]|uniref:Response regulator/sigma54 interaction protein n=1 Tax=Paraprevotella clara YIT 11840 TaxID=762968 RepID=G5SMZ8_9BACT|nr:sigma-54 dependent transcriptional regulator [Paraprevotella clara]EHH01415.1 response regulator/sigma54 interaction protein [Paraprevotella clara YIT 11840]
MGKVIVIDDNVVYCDYVGNLLAKEGIAIEKIYSFAAAKKALSAVRSDEIVLSDFRFPDGDGIELLRLMCETGHRNPFFIMTDYDEVPTAVRSMKSGADDYISKRKLEDELLPVIRNLLKRKSLANTNGENIFQRESEAFQFIDRRIRLVASTNISVLILGENGTGKEHIAEKIHRLSDRANKPFVAVDCGLLSASLAASTLFGHEKGAFTGATDNKAGYFRESDGGTLFLDEVGNLPMEVQQMLLRAIQSKTYRSVGGSQDKVADIRIIAATNEDLKKAVEEKRFRQDLYYRIQEFVIELPPLRKCREDILPLAKFFIDKMNTELNKSVSGLDEEATERLQLYNWPGNVRELRQTIQTAVLMTGNGMITTETLGLPEEVVYANSDFSLIDDEIQKERIIKALKQADGNKRQAARLLGISPPTLYKKLEQYNIQ